MPPRGTILLGLSFFAFIAWIIAMSTDIAWADSARTQGFGGRATTRTNMDTWFTCVQQEANGEDTVPICFRNGDSEISCQAYTDRFRVVQAFLVLAGIMTLFLMIASALDRFTLLSDVQHRVGPRTILVTLFVCLVLFSIVAFAVAFSIPKTSLCEAGEFESNDGFSWGPAPFFMVLMCLLGLIGLAIAALKKDYDHARDPANRGAVGHEYPSNYNHPSGNNHHHVAGHNQPVVTNQAGVYNHPSGAARP